MVVVCATQNTERRNAHEKEDHDPDDGGAPAAHGLWADGEQFRIDDAASGGGAERSTGHRAHGGQDAGRCRQPAR